MKYIGLCSKSKKWRRGDRNFIYYSRNSQTKLKHGELRLQNVFSPLRL